MGLKDWVKDVVAISEPIRRGALFPHSLSEEGIDGSASIGLLAVASATLHTFSLNAFNYQKKIDLGDALSITAIATISISFSFWFIAKLIVRSPRVDSKHYINIIESLFTIWIIFLFITVFLGSIFGKWLSEMVSTSIGTILCSIVFVFFAIITSLVLRYILVFVEMININKIGGIKMSAYYLIVQILFSILAYLFYFQVA